MFRTHGPTMDELNICHSTQHSSRLRSRACKACHETIRFYITYIETAHPKKQTNNFFYDLNRVTFPTPNPRRQNTFATSPVVLLLLPLPIF